MKGMQGRLSGVCAGLLGLVAAPAMAVSEEDYFTDMPVVLSVSRLHQPLDETPGAVTVLDRETIRRSGARTVAEVLRLVPGFVTSHFEGAARPIAHYHADYDAIVRHLQIFIDGRSVYSTLLVGTASYGMLSVVMEDIERIEVLRGSNSAAYGANAFLGVVNIVTRHAADTRGGLVAVSAGQTDLRDGVARIGWGDERTAFRLTAASRRDEGFAEVSDTGRIEQMHFRGDVQVSPADDLAITAGHGDLHWDVGGGAQSRGESWRNSYARVQWTRRLNATDLLKVGATADEESYGNFYPLLRADGTSRRLELGAEHSLTAGDRWRWVWGGQYHHEELDSPDLFNDPAGHRFDLWRIFANAEWKPHARWVVNAGGLWERHSIVGGRGAPRLMVNYHLLPGHTLRVGTTTAHKEPTLFELRADWRSGGTPVIQASGRARPERVKALELGYLGSFPAAGLTADVRAFREKVSDILRFERPCSGCANDLVNKDPNTQQGWEMQLRWQPVAATQFLLNHTELRLITDPVNTAPQDRERAPRHFSTLAWFQRLPWELDLAVIHTAVASYFYIRKADMIPAYRQTDVRLAHRFRIGSTRAEGALTVRAIDGEHQDFVERGLPPMVVDTRAVASLRLEF